VNWLKKEIFIFLSSVMFFSRIPVFRFFNDSEEFRKFNIKYLPLVGGVLGCLQAGVFLAVHSVLPLDISIVITMIAALILTGAFHEDGLADTADGIGGGYTREKILLIMKDSRIGTFGTAAFVSALALKFTAFDNLPSEKIPCVLIASQSVSRIFPLIMVFFSKYITDADAAKSKFVAKGISASCLIFGFAIGFASLFLIFDSWEQFAIMPVLLILFFLVKQYFENAVGGYTGDILGAIQQIFELNFLIALVVLWKFI